MSRGWLYDRWMSDAIYAWAHGLDTPDSWLDTLAETEHKAAWIPQDTLTPSPAWQPKDITAETLVAVPGQGAKL